MVALAEGKDVEDASSGRGARARRPLKLELVEPRGAYAEGAGRSVTVWPSSWLMRSTSFRGLKGFVM